MTAEQFLACGRELGRVRKIPQAVCRIQETLGKVCGMRTNALKIVYIEATAITKMLRHNSHHLEAKKTGYLLSHVRFQTSRVIIHNRSVTGQYFNILCDFEVQSLSPYRVRTWRKELVSNMNLSVFLQVKELHPSFYVCHIYLFFMC